MGAAPSAIAVAAHENDNRHRLHAAPIPSGVGRPPRQEVLVALELPGGASGRQAIVELHHQVDRRARRAALDGACALLPHGHGSLPGSLPGALACGGVLCADLDHQLRAQRVEAIDLRAPAGAVGAQEVVRDAAAREPQLRGAEGQRPACVGARRRRERRFGGPSQHDTPVRQGARERERPAGRVYVAARAAQARGARGAIAGRLALSRHATGRPQRVQAGVGRDVAHRNAPAVAAMKLKAFDEARIR